MANPNSLKNLAREKPRWFHLPTVAIRVPEVLSQQILDFARSLDQGKPVGEITRETVSQWIKSLDVEPLQLLEVELKSALIQAKERKCDRRLEQAICYLASRCDGALFQDGAGFNKADTNFGKWLSECISQKKTILKSHAQAALRMLQKYTKQLERGGLTLPEWEAIAHQYPDKIKLTTLAMVEGEEKSIIPDKRIQVIGDKIAVYAPYDSTGKFQREAKAIEGYKFEGSDKSWRYPLNKIEEVLAKFPKDIYQYDPNLEGAIALHELQKAEELARLEAEALEKSGGIIKLVQAADLDAPLANGWYLRDYQKRGVEWLLAHRRDGIYRGGILADHMGLGKAQPLDSKILTPTGWKLMGDVQTGDAVINSQGTTSYVTGVYPQGKKDIYRVVFTDGSSTECCDDHLWAVQSPWRKKYQGNFTIKSLSEIRQNLKEKNGNLKHYIPMVKPIDFKEQFVNIHPYLLGVLLGDGHLRYDSISFSTADEFILDQVERLTRVFGVNTKAASSCNYRLSRISFDWPRNYLLSELRELGLAGKNSYNKFIPDCYKFNTIANRIDLLQGLMDTDGSISNNVLEFSSSSYSLAKDLQFLVQSLGGKCTFKQRVPFCVYSNGERKAGQISYRLVLCLPPGIMPFKLPRKVEQYKHREKYLPCRGIKEIHYICKKEAQCISVDALDCLYITDDCIVTHNTLTTLIAARAMQSVLDCPIFVVAPVSLLDNWLREAERAQVRIECFSWAKMPKPLDTQKYVLICDESHYMQNIDSQRTKKALELAQHENCLASWLLTGTPIKNGRPINLYPLLLAVDHPLSFNKWDYQKYYCNAHQKSIGKKTIWDNTGAAHLDELSRKTEDVILRRTKQECLTELPAKTRLFKQAELEPSKAKEYDVEIKKLVREYKDRAKAGLVDPDAEALVTLNYLRKVGSQFKVDSAIALAEELLEQGQQVVLFTEFLESASRVYARLGGELLTGESKAGDRQAMIDRFQSGESKVFTGTIKAGGVGITLTAASNVILVDRPWTPGDCEQAEDRCHRLGQENAVFATWLQLGQIDYAIDSLLEAKQQRIELVLKGKRKTLRGLDSPKELAKQLLEIL